MVLDDCHVPESLRSIVWVKIEDLKNLDHQVEQIVMSIYGYQEKPPLGAPPKYVQSTIENIPELTPTDSLVLKLACEKANVTPLLNAWLDSVRPQN